MKKLLTVLVALLLVFGLVGCNKNNGGNEPAPAPEGEGETAPEGEAAPLKIAYFVSHLGDKSFADSGERGMQQLKGEGYEQHTFEIGDDTSTYKDQIND
ncbi:MAG: hypothetical protein II577_02810, partial [Erysipelotrichaceae bacterium]|nr:hypothetical protein [Erysipelotrichaceae bacterium]